MFTSSDAIALPFPAHVSFSGATLMLASSDGFVLTSSGAAMFIGFEVSPLHCALELSALTDTDVAGVEVHALTAAAVIDITKKTNIRMQSIVFVLSNVCFPICYKPPTFASLIQFKSIGFSITLSADHRKFTLPINHPNLFLE
jgi:hypothetical protein